MLVGELEQPTNITEISMCELETPGAERYKYETVRVLNMEQSHRLKRHRGQSTG